MCAAAAKGTSLSAPPRQQATWSPAVVTYGENFAGPWEVPKGLRYSRDFLTEAEELELLDVLDGDDSRWMRHIRRAQQFFGLVYYQTSQAVPELQPTSASPEAEQRGRALESLPPWLLPRVLGTGAFGDPAEAARRGAVNQVQANEYLEDSGIGVHVEDPAAGPTLATVSLLEPVQLTLSRAVDGCPVSRERRDLSDCLKVLLEPRSLLVLQGESRYGFAHAIRTSKLVPLRDGTVLRRGKDFRRVSLTFRGIVEDQRSSHRMDTPEGYTPFTLPSP